MQKNTILNTQYCMRDTKEEEKNKPGKQIHKDNLIVQVLAING